MGQYQALPAPNYGPVGTFVAAGLQLGSRFPLDAPRLDTLLC